MSSSVSAFMNLTASKCSSRAPQGIVAARLAAVERLGAHHECPLLLRDLVRRELERPHLGGMALLVASSVGLVGELPIWKRPARAASRSASAPGRPAQGPPDSPRPATSPVSLSLAVAAEPPARAALAATSPPARHGRHHRDDHRHPVPHPPSAEAHQIRQASPSSLPSRALRPTRSPPRARAQTSPFPTVTRR